MDDTAILLTGVGIGLGIAALALALKNYEANLRKRTVSVEEVKEVEV